MSIVLQRSLAALSCAALLLAGCSGESDKIVDPNIYNRTETALLAVNSGGAGQLIRYSEPNSMLGADEIAPANGGAGLTEPINMMTEAYDQLYLVHRNSGAITVLDLTTRKKIARLEGFDAPSGGGLLNIVFSNQSQAWAVSTGSPKLYQIDAERLTVLAPIPLSGEPTAIGTSGTRVFVGVRDSSGAYRLLVFSSNTGVVPPPLEETLTFPSPIVAIAGVADGQNAMIMTAGGVGLDPFDSARAVGPTIYSVGTKAPVGILSEVELPYAPITDRVGKPLTWFIQTRDDYAIAALPGALTQIDVRGLGSYDLAFETFDVLGADYFTGLIYAAASGNPTQLRRFTQEGSELTPLTLPAPVADVQFVNPNRLK